ncbi:transmembrane protein 45B [Elysia marginata]|uniref:Transmembrane protein 45B n=1 Tax=Elysia marginata TaxID=1093978 RepID=A0AAV4F5R9_9GAST|nr:transmembrane protein 45B [Elysia marginata]
MTCPCVLPDFVSLHPVADHCAVHQGRADLELRHVQRLPQVDQAALHHGLRSTHSRLVRGETAQEFSNKHLLLLHYKLPVPRDLDYEANTCFFLVETFTIYWHLHGCALDYRVHVLFLVAIVMGSVAVVVEAKAKHHMTMPILRGTIFMLKGTWLVQNPIRLDLTMSTFEPLRPVRWSLAGTVAWLRSWCDTGT